MKKGFCFFISCLNLYFAFCQKEKLTLESIWKSKKFAVKHVNTIKFIHDEDYIQLTFSQLNSEFYIIKHDLVTGSPKDTLLSSNDLKKNNINYNWLPSDYFINSTLDFLLLITNQESVYRHSTLADYFIFDIKNKKMYPLSQKCKIAFAEFSPDGKMICYSQENNLYIKNLDSMSDIQITTDGQSQVIHNGMPDWVYEEEFSLKKAFTWSSDGRFLAYLKFDLKNTPFYTLQKWAENTYPQNELFRYPKAGENNAQVALVIFDVLKKTNLLIGNFGNNQQYIPRLTFIDNQHLLIQTLNRTQNNWSILKFNMHQHKLDTLYAETSETYIEITDDLFFYEPDKRVIISSDKDGFRHIYSLDLVNKSVEKLTHGNWEVDKIYGINPKNGYIYFTCNKDGIRFKNLYFLNLMNRTIKSLSNQNGYYEISLSTNKQIYLQTYSNLNTPPQFSFHTCDGELIRYVEKNSDVIQNLTCLKLTIPEFTTLHINDNVALEACIFKPLNFTKKKKYPVLFYVYGGPNYQIVLDKWQYNAYLWNQFLAQHGFIIVMVDPRGSGGKGRSFAHVHYLKLGMYETHDLIEAAKIVSQWPYVDKKKIGIWGWSYGGYLSTLALALGNSIFSFAIAVAPVTNWKLYDSIYTERYLRTPKENPYGYENFSPLKHAHLIKGKYFLIHGTADDNVHVQHSLLMQKALVEAGKQFTFFVYTDKNHDLSGGNTRHHLYEMMFEFIMNSIRK
jgi:dipeptidyl-peptidase-4